jgi:hypothetical protein
MQAISGIWNARKQEISPGSQVVCSGVFGQKSWEDGQRQDVYQVDIEHVVDVLHHQLFCGQALVFLWILLDLVDSSTVLSAFDLEWKIYREMH